METSSIDYLAPADPRSQVVGVRLTSVDHAALKAMAQRAGVPMSRYAGHCLVTTLREELATVSNDEPLELVK